VSNPEAIRVEPDRRVSSVIGDLIHEMDQFFRTHIELLKAEMREKFPHLRNAVLLTFGATLFLVTGYLFLALALVVLIASAFPANVYRWFFGFLIIGILTAGFGAIAAFLAKSEFDPKSMLPRRTLTVLKHDKDWIREEVSNRWTARETTASPSGETRHI
jgi:uncharacterized membrane protein YqjE